MSVSFFSLDYRIGHIGRIKRTHSYLCKQKCGSVRLRTDELDLLAITYVHYYWEESVCGKVEEVLPNNGPESLGKCAVIINLCDDSMCFSLITGRLVSGVLYFVEKTPVKWHSKKQSIAKAAACKSECSCSRVCVEKIIDARIT